MQDNNFENGFEKAPGTGELSGDQVLRAEAWDDSMSANVPPFAGEQFGTAHDGNEYYGEKPADEAGENYDQGVSDAAALINYGLNAAAREKGVEYVVQAIKHFDASGRENPIRDLMIELGIDTVQEVRDTIYEGEAAKFSENSFRDGPNAPATMKRSNEGAFAAIDDMKELIYEVEGADPKYEALRAGAKAAGKGYFEYAVSSFGTRGLTELFQVLASQREEKPEDKLAEEGEEIEETPETEIPETEGEEDQEKPLDPETILENEAQK